MTMTERKPPPLPATADPQDPYKIRSIEQILSLFDGGDFLARLLDDHENLKRDLLEYREEHGTKGCKGSMTIKIDYDLGKSGDVGMGATAEFKSPRKPPSSAAAFINDDGELTLYSPFLARMQQPVRDVTTNYDPETGEVRDPS